MGAKSVDFIEVLVRAKSVNDAPGRQGKLVRLWVSIWRRTRYS